MTTLRDPAQIQSVVWEYIQTLTGKTCADVIGKSESLIYKASAEGSQVRLTLLDMIKLDAAVASMRQDSADTPFASYVRRMVQQLSGWADSSEPDLLAEALDVGAAVGEVQAAIRAALNPNSPGGARITHNESVCIRSAANKVGTEVSQLSRAAAQADNSTKKERAR